MVIISFIIYSWQPSCPYVQLKLLLSLFFASSLIPSIPGFPLRKPRPFCPPLASSLLALVLSSFTSPSLSLFPTFKSAVNSLSSVIYLSVVSQKTLSLYVHNSLYASFPLLSPSCKSCTHWMSGEHLDADAVECGCVGVCVSVSLSPCWLIMWLINSRCQAQYSPTHILQTQTYTLWHSEKQLPKKHFVRLWESNWSCQKN